MNRRTLLQRLAGFSLLSGAGWLLQRRFFPTAPVYDQEATWRAWIEHLIPADETPGALDLGLEQSLWVQAAQRPELMALIEQGCVWLQQTALQNYQLDFSDLNETQAETIVTHAAQAHAFTLPRRFFTYTRMEAMQAFYADPRSRVGSVWERNPQPAGHPDYQQPCQHV